MPTMRFGGDGLPGEFQRPLGWFWDAVASPAEATILRLDPAQSVVAVEVRGPRGRRGVGVWDLASGRAVWAHDWAECRGWPLDDGWCGWDRQAPGRGMRRSCLTHGEPRKPGAPHEHRGRAAPNGMPWEYTTSHEFAAAVSAEDASRELTDQTSQPGMPVARVRRGLTPPRAVAPMKVSQEDIQKCRRKRIEPVLGGVGASVVPCDSLSRRF